jgi:hypothetical protein
MEEVAKVNTIATHTMKMTHPNKFINAFKALVNCVRKGF